MTLSQQLLAKETAYRAVRGKADSHVEAALPRLGVTLQRHAPTG